MTTASTARHKDVDESIVEVANLRAGGRGDTVAKLVPVLVAFAFLAIFPAFGQAFYV